MQVITPFGLLPKAEPKQRPVWVAGEKVGLKIYDPDTEERIKQLREMCGA